MENKTPPPLTTEQAAKVMVFLAIAAFFVWMLFADSNTADNHTGTNGDRSGSASSYEEPEFVPTALNASVMSHNFVKGRLKSPSTAEFSPSNEEIVKQENDSTWVVIGYVDSQNGFGAMIRAKYLCIITYRGDMAILKEIIIE